ncbi:Uncharacterised protein, partial [Mycoplasmopsis edwardii]
MKNDKEFILKAVEIDTIALEYASKKIIYNNEFIKEIIKINPASVTCVLNNIEKYSPEFISW